MIKRTLILLIALVSGILQAGESFIPLDPIRIPSKDLIFEGENVSAERAAQLQEQGVDLSK
ncbi:MAG: hypothetical protein EP319_06745, partial [Deltaproteobacteria bacterium]